ncbi:MAG: helix-turn-helix transcriptional regulator [Collinsella sp.]|nr:helix-turn-helix transcriptional regulator [Collinsella sp.]
MATEYVLDAEKIARWRADYHMPLKQLARAAGVDMSSLSHAISQGRNVKMNMLLNLAAAMGEDPRDIVRPKALASQETK